MRCRAYRRRAYSVCPGTKERIVLVDFGSKSGIIRDLTKRGRDVVVVPQDTTAEQIRRLAPDGILLSNGPGDPKDVPHAAKMIAELLGEFPIFGICLGHQLFALASGADTEKLKFGHRGGNHPVKELKSGRRYITSQNHGYTVKEESIAGTELEVTHINNNDRTIEGLRHKKYPAFSVQYHPEAAPGPFDSSYLFDEFLTLIREHKESNPVLPKQAQIAAAYQAARTGSANAAKGELHYAEK
ncbi:carbamoyl phosphate synthase small subunit [Paenibacillus sp. P26]|nr:carbamoyl phosphate synthase small subunit [Paenibacillus sp. P26]